MKSMTAYVSDTLAGSANQTWFDSDGEWHRARVYYRLFSDETAPRILTFGAVIDGTFDDGSRSVCNMPCEPYELSVKVGVCSHSDVCVAVEPIAMQEVTFGGRSVVTVTPEAPVQTDAFSVDTADGQCLCVELRYRGRRVPCHEELRIAAFAWEDGRWRPSTQCPVPLFVGVKRAVDKRVAFLGDSITQGIGATPDSYRHWCALTAQKLGKRHAYRNLGIGFARSGDAASNGVWLDKAKQNDIVFLCLGVNDLLRGVPADEVVDNIQTTVSLLRERGITVFLQSVPPFELFGEDGVKKQRYVNERIAHVGDGFFDNTAFLTKDDMPVYGGHPSDDGCAVWAERLCRWIKDTNASLFGLS